MALSSCGDWLSRKLANVDYFLLLGFFIETQSSGILEIYCARGE